MRGKFPRSDKVSIDQIRCDSRCLGSVQNAMPQSFRSHRELEVMGTCHIHVIISLHTKHRTLERERKRKEIKTTKRHNTRARHHKPCREEGKQRRIIKKRIETTINKPT
jgi:hypothetical protein